MEMLEVNGVAIHTHEIGPSDGPTLFFANSLGTDFRIWQKFIPYIPNSYKAIFYDKRGHGLSEVAPGSVSISDLASDVVRIADAKSVDTFCIIGVSIGGQIGLEVASQYPDRIGALVFSNSAPKIRDEEFWDTRIQSISQTGILPAADRILEMWFSEDFRNSCPIELKGWKAMLSRIPMDGYLACCEALKLGDLRSHASQIEHETLVIAGTEDGSTPPELVKEGYKQFKNAQFKVIHGSGHLPPIEKPKEFAQLIFPFIESTKWYNNL